MNSFIFIFVPRGTPKPDFEAAIRQHLDSPEFIEIPTEADPERVNDPDQLPLWRWFISSK